MRGIWRGLWRAPHLPLFLLAVVWATLVPLVWLWPDLTCDPVAWHRQELVLGFAGAAMGGYLLTALPHWLKLAGVAGAGVPPSRTAALVAAWAVGRLSGGACQPDTLALAGLALFPLGLTLSLALPVARAGAWSRLPIALAPLLLLLIAARLRLAADSRTAVLGVALLVALVGGRIVPAFLAARTGDPRPRRRLPRGDRLADLALALALALQLGGAGDPWIGGLLLVAALGQTLRMRNWPLRPALVGNPDLMLLLWAWLWLPGGLLLVGVEALGAPILQAGAAAHALTMGMLGSMVLAVMSRSWMRRAPGRLAVGWPTLLAFGLLQSATLLRLCATEAGGAAAVVLWCCAWGLAAASCIAAIRRPVPHPILSAAR